MLNTDNYKNSRSIEYSVINNSNIKSSANNKFSHKSLVPNKADYLYITHDSNDKNASNLICHRKDDSYQNKFLSQNKDDDVIGKPIVKTKIKSNLINLKNSSQKLSKINNGNGILMNETNSPDHQLVYNNSIDNKFNNSNYRENEGSYYNNSQASLVKKEFNFLDSWKGKNYFLFGGKIFLSSGFYYGICTLLTLLVIAIINIIYLFPSLRTKPNANIFIKQGYLNFQEFAILFSANIRIIEYNYNNSDIFSQESDFQSNQSDINEDFSKKTLLTLFEICSTFEKFYDIENNNHSEIVNFLNEIDYLLSNLNKNSNITKYSTIKEFTHKQSGKLFKIDSLEQFELYQTKSSNIKAILITINVILSFNLIYNGAYCSFSDPGAIPCNFELEDYIHINKYVRIFF